MGALRIAGAIVGSVTVLGLAACGSSDDGGGGGSGGGGGKAGADAGVGGNGGAGGLGGADASTLPDYYLEVVKPSEGQVHVQTGLPPMTDVSFEVLAGPGIAKVEYVIETGFSLGDSTAAPSFPLTYPYEYPGDRWAEARGFDGNGAQVASDIVNFVVKAPAATGCLEQLDQLGVQYTTTSAKGVVDGVKLAGPINGVLFAKTDTDQPSTDPMACEFVLTLWKFADVLKAHGFNKVGTLGSYCYRCCCAWSQTNYCRGPNDPEPDCSQNGYSNHSWGRAMDMRWLYKSTGEVYDVNDPTDFVKWPSSSETCTAALAAQTGISKELYSLVCDQADKGVFGICLTPNYNSVHRNHFHCDIGQSGTPTSNKVLTSPLVSSGPAVDFTDHPDE